MPTISWNSQTCTVILHITEHLKPVLVFFVKFNEVRCYGLVSSMQSTNCCCVLPVHKAPRINLGKFRYSNFSCVLIARLNECFFFYMCRHCFCNCAICKGNSKGINSNCQLAQTENLVIQQMSSSETRMGIVCSFVQLVGGHRYKNTWMSCILLCPAQNEFIKITLNWHFTVTLRKLVK